MEELQQQGGSPAGGFPPAPMSPTGAPGVPQGGEEMASPEQKQQLLDMIDGIKGQMGNLDVTRKAGEDKLNRTKQEMLRRVFEILQLAGVDLSVQDSVAGFLEKLRTENPQLAQWFEESMNIFLGEEIAEPTEGEMPGMGLQEQLPQNENEYEDTSTIQPPTQDIS